jgi:hypothetical protein
VLGHFGVPESAHQSRRILAGPTMRQYAKEPAQRFDAALRRQLLDQAARRHADEIARGLRWLDRATADEPTARILARCLTEPRPMPC